MSSGFTFGAAKPAETTTFKQNPTFVSPQPGSLTFGAQGAGGAASLPQFSSTFGTGQAAGGFPFTSPVTAAPTSAFLTPSHNFNTAAVQPSLKPNATNFTAPVTGFGSPINTGATFGTAQSHQLYGNTTLAPNTSLAFGSPKPAVTGIGLPFGVQSSTAPTTGLTFATNLSTTPASSTGLTFGPTVSTTSNPGFSFPIPTATKTGSTFSSPAVPTATGLGFGASVAAPTAPNSGLTFNASAFPAAPSTGLTFGATPVPSTKPLFGSLVSSPAVNLNFAAPSLPASTTALSYAAPVGLNFSAPLVTSAPPAFATTVSSAPGLSFPLSLPSSTAAVLNFATPTLTGTTSTTTIAVASATSTATVTGAATAIPITTTTIGFGRDLISSTTATSTGLSFDLGATALPKLPATSTVSSFNLLSQPSSSAPSALQRSVGLGGISATPPKQPPTSTSITTDQAELTPRDQVLPNELLQTVEHFKKFVQEQKSFSSEVARFSVKDLKKVETDIDLVNNCISEIGSELQKNKTAAETLKFDTARGLHNAEMAQRTFDIPSGLQYENTAPLNYFFELSVNLEKEMNALKIRIENIDKRVRNTGPLTALTPQDLALGMRRLHETFVALAGRLQSVHNQVEFQKEQYLSLRKHLFNDSTNVFEDRSKELEALEVALDSLAHQPPAVFTGPTPFGSLGNSQAQAVAQNPPPSYPGITPSAAPTQGYNITAPSTVPLFGSNTSSLFNTSSTAFNLQKPPVGNKRGKP